MQTEGEKPNGKLRRLAEVSLAFTPAAPVDNTALFAERDEQVMQCIEALFQKGMHIALYGERGVGKTSLANVLPKLVTALNLPDLRAVRIDCNTNDSFATIWRKVFRGLGDSLDEIDRQDLRDPEDVRFSLEARPSNTLIVIDELDRVEDDDALSLLADTLKTLSDHASNATVMVVGVANSIEQLVGEHESIVRCLAQVPTPRMSDRELNAILEKGFGRVGLTIEDGARHRIVQTAEGLPHFVHLLGLHSAQTAVQDDREDIALSDVERAERRAVQSHSILSEYEAAIQSPQKDHLFEEVLLACAYARKNSLGYFRPSDVREPVSAIVGRELQIPNFARHLNELSSSRRSNALLKHGEPRRYVYRFRNPLLQPFAKIVGRTKALITTETASDLEARQRHPGGSGESDPSAS